MERMDRPSRDGATGSATDEIQLVTFFLGAEEYGLPIDVVREIVRVPAITPVPRAPADVEGLANLRGSVLPVLCLRRRFGLPAVDRDDDARIVVADVRGRPTGLVVDRVSEVLRVPAGAVLPPPPVALGGRTASMIRGVATQRAGERLTTLLDIGHVVPAAMPEGRAAEGARPNGGPSRAVDAVALAVGEAGRVANGRAATADGAGSDVVGAREQVVSFRLGNAEYAVSLVHVQEIIRVPAISHVPQAPAFVAGVASLRERLLPVVDLRRRFGLSGATADDEDRRVLVLAVDGALTGLLVDGVAEVLSLPPDAVEAPPRVLHTSEGDVPLRGLAKLEGGARLLLLVDAARLLWSGDERSAPADAAAERPEGGDATRPAPEEAQFVGFRLGDEAFGVEIRQVQEIINLPPITVVPRTPPFVEGIFNLRGAVLPVIDLRKRFGMPPSGAKEDTSVVVVDVGGARTGVIVDAMLGVLRVRHDAIEAPPRLSVPDVEAACVRGVGTLDDGRRLLVLLELEAVLATGARAAAA